MRRILGVNCLTVLTKARPFPDHLLTGGFSGVIHRFGQFELDDSKRELRADGHRVDTEPKAFEMLLFLLHNRDRAVSKDELLEALWPHTIVSETALSRCVMKARRAVGDDSDSQAVIRTLHGHGYRFVARLESTADAQPASPARPAGPWKYFGGVAAAALILIAATALYLRQPESDTPFVGTVAVLPVINLVDDDELRWVRVGLMSIIKRMLEDGGIRVVSERTVLGAVGDAGFKAPPDESQFDQLRRQTGSDAVLHTTLDTRGGLQRLSAVLTRPDGRKTRRVIVGDSPAMLAAEMAGVIIGLIAHEDRDTTARFAKVSTDPFVNEMYARALDLELQGKLDEARQMFRVAADQEPELFWLRYEIALCTRDLREWDAAESMFDALLEEANSGEDARASIATLNSYGVMMFKQNRYDEAEQLYLRAVDAAAERSHASDRATAHTNLALINTRKGAFETARSHYDAVLAAHEEAGQEPSAFFYNNFAGFLLEQGDFEQALEYSERAVAKFRLRGQRRFEAPSLNRLAKITRLRGDMEAAIAKHRQALSIYQDLGNTVGERSVMSALTLAYRQSGDLTRAKLNAEEVIARALETDDELLHGDAFMQRAYVEESFGNYENAITDFESAHEIFVRIGDNSGAQDSNLGIALASLENGDVDRAKSIADAMQRSAMDANSGGSAARATWLKGRIASATNDMEDAEPRFREALEYARASSDQSLKVLSAIDLGNQALARDEIEEATSLLEEIRPVAGVRHEFRRLEARVAAARGQREQAKELLMALRANAGEAWTAEDDALLRSLSE